MPYRGRITEIGAYGRPNPHVVPFTAIENGQSGFLVDGGIAGPMPGVDPGGQIPFLSANVFGFDVPPLAFTAPIKLIGNAPPGSTMPTTIPTDPKYYGQPEGAQDFQKDYFGQSFDGTGGGKVSTANGQDLSGIMGFDPSKQLGAGAPPIDAPGFSANTPSPAVIEKMKKRAAELAAKAQADADKAEKTKKLILFAGLGIAAYFIFRG